MFANFDDSVLEIIEDAKEYTKERYKIDKLGTESLLYVMFSKEESICRFLLEDYRVTSIEIMEAMEEYVIIRNNNNLYTEKFLEVLEMAKAIAKENKSQIVLEEHLLFSLLVVKDTIFESLIKKLNLNSLLLIEDLKEYFYISTTDEINNYSTNLTTLAKEGKLNKLIGREHYLHRMKIVLERKNKNNILLVGSAGVGKTALVEGLCYELLKDGSKFEVVSVSVASLVANTKYRGDFEARINKVLNDVISSSNKILFIDEIHTIVGAGSSDNSMDIANILKPYLVRDNFRCIGATTIEEYEKHIAKDKALARRFQPIFVNELNVAETKNVLNGIVSGYVEFHKTYLDKNYIDYIIKLSNEKITNRKFPDKAIDLMDEAMCLAKFEKSKSVKIHHIEEAIKNICGIEVGDINYSYIYNELESYILDNYLGVSKNKRLLSINFEGDDDNLELLKEELKRGFGIGEEAILDIDLAHFNEQNSLSSLLGTPPGYVGYDDGGILSEHFSKYLSQIIIMRDLDKASNDIIGFVKAMIKHGFFYDKKGREFYTKNTIFIFVGKQNLKKDIGFVVDGEPKLKPFMECDITLSNKKTYKQINTYIDSFRFKGFDVSFNEEEFDKHQDSFKKGFIDLVRSYKKGKYFLFYNSKTNKIEITSD